MAGLRMVRLLPGLAASAGAFSAGGGGPMPPSGDPVAIDHLRAHPSYVAGERTAGGGRSPGQWQDPKSLPPASVLPGVSAAMTRDGTAHQMLEHAQKVLPEQHYRALELKVQGEEPEA